VCAPPVVAFVLPPVLAPGEGLVGYDDDAYEGMPALIDAQLGEDNLPLAPPVLYRQNYIQQFYHMLMNPPVIDNAGYPANIEQEDQEFLLEYILGLNENV
jgi:hypothetical protein